MSDMYQTPEAELGVEIENTSGMGANAIIPDEIKGWSWGGFLLTWIWAIGNRSWIGLLALLPYVGFVVAIVIGIKGREWAWKNKRWDSIEHFKRVQKIWAICGFALILVVIVSVVGLAALDSTNY